jgi:hypothetical protein
VDSTTEQIGSLSATCSGNPYEGVTFTSLVVASTEGFINPFDLVGPCDLNGTCTFTPSGPPQFLEGDVNVIPANTTAVEVQAIVDGFCSEALVVPSTLSQCSAELRLSGDNPKNKHPGSILSFDFMTNTTVVAGKLL